MSNKNGDNEDLVLLLSFQPFNYLRDFEMEAGSLPIKGKGPLSSQKTLAEHGQKNGKSARED